MIIFDALFIIMIGLILGSFLNVIIYRMPIMLEKKRSFINDFNLFIPRSHCRNCKKTIKIYQNIPVFSYLFLKGKCANCNHTISAQYPFIELLTSIFTVHAFLYFNFSPELFAILIFIYALIVISVIDFNHKIIPDSLSLILLISGLIYSLIFLSQGDTSFFIEPVDSISGIFMGYCLLFIIYKIHFTLTGKEGLGFGDIKLLAALGAWIGWKLIPLVLFLAAVFGLIYALSIMFIKKININESIPFGPFLALSAWITLFYNAKILEIVTFF